jgi:hypothetical protein
MNRYIRQYLGGLVLITITDLLMHSGIARDAVYFIMLPSLGIVLGLQSMLAERKRHG